MMATGWRMAGNRNPLAPTPCPLTLLSSSSNSWSPRLRGRDSAGLGSIDIQDSLRRDDVIDGAPIDCRRERGAGCNTLSGRKRSGSASQGGCGASRALQGGRVRPPGRASPRGGGGGAQGPPGARYRPARVRGCRSPHVSPAGPKRGAGRGGEARPPERAHASLRLARPLGHASADGPRHQGAGPGAGAFQVGPDDQNTSRRPPSVSRAVGSSRRTGWRRATGPALKGGVLAPPCAGRRR